MAAARRTWSLRTYVPALVAGALTALLVSLRFAGVDMPVLQGVIFFSALGFLSFGFVDLLVRDIRRTYVDPVGERVIVLGVMVVEAVFLFAALYLTISQHPDQIAGLETPLDAVYFTMTTLMTIGFGDVSAHGQWARGAVLLQMLFSVLLLSASVRMFTSLVRSMTAEAGKRHQD
ncbi:MAG: potassium channel family protein [Candidatus Nanopelagicales bacterium]